jgi:hypothetical protein
MMTTVTTALDWLSSIAWKRPRTLAIILLAGCLIVSTRVIMYQQSRIVYLETLNRSIQSECTQRVDSITLRYVMKESELALETRTLLNSVIDDYKSQLEEQRSLNHRVNTSILQANKTLKNNEQKLKQLKDVN